MVSKLIVAALLSTALMTGVASAQTSTTNTTDRASLNAVMHKDGEWRSSKLVGLDVYNDAHDKIGNVQELIVDKSGKVDKVILGVGGFLGVDEHYVAVAFDKLKWVERTGSHFIDRSCQGQRDYGRRHQSRRGDRGSQSRNPPGPRHRREVVPRPCRL